MSSTSSSSSSSSSDSSGSSSDSSSSDTEQSAASQGSAPARKSPVKSPKPQPDRRRSSGSSAAAKSNRSEAQPKTTSRKVSSTTGPQSGRSSSAARPAAPARGAPKSPVRRAAADSKAAAKKSIFSPDESSASETESSSKPANKQTGKKTARKPNGSVKNSSVSSSRVGSGADSGSSSAAEEADGGAASSRLPAAAPPKPAAAAPGSSDSEAVRRRTRSTRPSRSQLKRSAIYNTDSESETADSQQGTKGPRKKKRLGGTTGTVPPQRPSAADQPPQQRPPTLGEASCPVPDCDGRGHLSGLHERHFCRAACPLYHRTTDAEAKDHQLEREIRASDRQKALNKYRPSQQSPEQRSYLSRVTSQRRQTQEPAERKPELLDEERSREIELENHTPGYDLSMFREAQAAASAQIEDSLRNLPDTPGLHSIEMGRFDMEVWYQSPYPEDFPRGSKMFICQYCLKYLRCRTSLERHNAKCVWRFPPGDEIYRKDSLSVFEVDGRRFKSYCQNLCLLAKLFLDNKTLYFDVEPFLFYVMTVADSEGCHVVGYFSKEKNSFLNYNVSCIMTLPPYQRQGYGRLLIDFSYLLTKTENKIGSPEKPLSDLGLISYRSYWKDALLRYFADFRGKVVSIKDISQEMAANSNDIVSTLQAVGIVKYWKNKHIILKRQDIFEEFEEKRRRRGPDHKEIDPKCLSWKPFQSPEQNKSS